MFLWFNYNRFFKLKRRKFKVIYRDYNTVYLRESKANFLKLLFLYFCKRSSNYLYLYFLLVKCFIRVYFLYQWHRFVLFRAGIDDLVLVKPKLFKYNYLGLFVAFLQVWGVFFYSTSLILNMSYNIRDYIEEHSYLFFDVTPVKIYWSLSVELGITFYVLCAVCLVSYLMVFETARWYIFQSAHIWFFAVLAYVSFEELVTELHNRFGLIYMFDFYCIYKPIISLCDLFGIAHIMDRPEAVLLIVEDNNNNPAIKAPVYPEVRSDGWKKYVKPPRKPAETFLEHLADLISGRSLRVPKNSPITVREKIGVQNIPKNVWSRKR